MSEAWETVVWARPGELDEELEWDAEERGEEEQAPLRAVEAGPVEDEQRSENKGGEQKAVEDHGADAHLGEGDLAEEEAAAPKGAGQGGGKERGGPPFWDFWHEK